MHSDKKICILLAEDNEFNQELIIDLLSEAGFSVVAANNGQEVLHLLEQHTPDFFQLILMDLEMPVMNGIEFATACKAHIKFSTIPIVAYTAAVNPELTQKTQGAGIAECILKTDRPGLLEAITSLLNAESRELVA